MRYLGVQPASATGGVGEGGEGNYGGVVKVMKLKV